MRAMVAGCAFGMMTPAAGHHCHDFVVALRATILRQTRRGAGGPSSLSRRIGQGAAMAGTKAVGGLQRQALQLASRAWRAAWKRLPAGAIGLRQPLAVVAQRLFGRPPAPPRFDLLEPSAQAHWLRRHATPSRAALSRALAQVAT